ncbi:SLC13 family permease [Nonlabens xiamenensis]|uniref:SLC13 family permease n=1 Tax=Nonlabens xiamenensis TaxID=2341043 RepID=UPI000F611864|nr:SLC13 family permease [Nonlabens xiamenensis]
MDLNIILVFSIILIAVVLFITELFPIDKVAFVIIAFLVLFNLTTPEEAISGFSNPATITILCLMILAVGLEDNGVIQWLTDGIKKLTLLPLILIAPAFMLISATVSAFISTTAVVIIFIKIVSQLADRYGFSRAKILMPISFAGILGGSCTLMGTSTNLLVNSISQNLGAERLGFFEFTLYGLCFLAIGVVFMGIAQYWLPKEREDLLKEDYEVEDYIFTLQVTADAKVIGKKIADVDFLIDDSTTLLKLLREGKVIHSPGKYISLQANDNLVLMGDLQDIQELIVTEGFIFNEERSKSHLQAFSRKEGEAEMTYVEILVLPGSHLIGKTLRKVRRMSIKGAYPIALRKRKNVRNTKARLLRKNVDDINIKPGDRLLLEMQEQRIAQLHDIENIAILNQHEYETKTSNLKKFLALYVLLGTIAAAASGVLTILSASLAGVAVMLLLNLISLQQIYHRVNWQIIFLLAGMIPLGMAMNNSGADQWLSAQLLELFSHQSPIIILGLTFGCTMLLSGIISNNATAIIMTPIAIAIASGSQLDLKPFILAVMFAANFSFFTPVGYQTNTLIYGTGIYKFKHFITIGGLLSLLLWVAGTLILSTML